MLSLSDISLNEAGVPHLNDLSQTFARGTMTTVLGRTGAGKTTLLRAIAGLTQPQSGRIALDGTDLSPLPPWKRPVAMVTQQFINYPHLSVLDNVAFPLIRAGASRAVAREAATLMLARVGLAALADRRPPALSGGPQQRVAIARALVKQAPVLLLDEPFVNLDYKLREGLREELADLLRSQSGTVVIYASTDPREALQMGDNVLLMSEGRALQVGPPRTVFAAPVTVEAARVVNDPPINLLQAEVGTHGLALNSLGLQAPRTIGRSLPPGRYMLGIRAEDISGGGPLPARVVLTEVSGSETVTHLDASGQSLVMQERSVTDRALGAKLGLTLNLTRALLFDDTGKLIGAGKADG